MVPQPAVPIARCHASSDSRRTPDSSYTIFIHTLLGGTAATQHDGNRKEATVDRDLSTMLKEIARLTASNECRISSPSSTTKADRRRAPRVTSTSAPWRNPQRIKNAA
jgi:hypothetical protein